MSRAKVKYRNDYLQLFMPNGDIIPEQTGIKIKNYVGDRKIATVTVTLLADISEIGEPINNNDNEEIIKSLEEKICISQKSAVFWENHYNNEKQRTWFDKLLGL